MIDENIFLILDVLGGGLLEELGSRIVAKSCSQSFLRVPIHRHVSVGIQRPIVQRMYVP